MRTVSRFAYHGGPLDGECGDAQEPYEVREGIQVTIKTPKAEGHAWFANIPSDFDDHDPELLHVFYRGATGGAAAMWRKFGNWSW